jgi:hypothetical protein
MRKIRAGGSKLAHKYIYSDSKPGIGILIQYDAVGSGNNEKVYSTQVERGVQVELVYFE